MRLVNFILIKNKMRVKSKTTTGKKKLQVGGRNATSWKNKISQSVLNKIVVLAKEYKKICKKTKRIL